MSTISASTTSSTAYKVTADTTGTLVLQTGATPTTAVTIDTSQNVGIGTSSPSTKLDVSGAINATTEISAVTANSNGPILRLNSTDAGGVNYAIVSGGSANGAFPTGKLTIRDSTVGANRLVLSSAGVVVTGTLSATTGAAVGGATAGAGGLAFPATASISADANTLDDYEEGTWTPSLGGNTTYTGRSGTYTKIGNTVRVYLEVTVNLIGTGSTTTMSGFPFSPFGNDAGCISYFESLNASVYWLTIQMQAGGNCVFAGTTAATATIVNGVSIFKNGSRILGTAVYQTSS